MVIISIQLEELGEHMLYPDVQEQTKKKIEYQKLILGIEFSYLLTKAMIANMNDSKPISSDTAPDKEDFQKWLVDEEKKRKLDLNLGTYFSYPQWETSFADSMRSSVLLAENGHYTQAMVLLRLAVNTILASAMKSILIFYPNRLKESKILQKMFLKGWHNKITPEELKVKLDQIDYSNTRDGIWSRNELSNQYHQINISPAIKELEVTGYINSKVVEEEFLKSGKKSWYSWIDIERLNRHTHCHDTVIDRFNEHSNMKIEREFIDELWDEFSSISFKIIDLKLSITASIHKGNIGAKLAGLRDKSAANNVEFLQHGHHVPNFCDKVNSQLITKCIKCKTRNLSASKVKERQYLCGNCIQDLENRHRNGGPRAQNE